MDGGDRYDLNEPRDMSSVHTEEEIKAMNDEETVDALNAMWSNFCVTDAYEPGSVVKPIVMAGAMEKGAISEDDTFECDGGQAFGANGEPYIKCAVWPSAHGSQGPREVIANSCNDGMMQIAAAMGADQFIKAQSLFNFGTRTGIDLPNEGSGIIHTTDTMGPTELACSAFGQGIYLHHAPGDQRHVFCDQRRLLLSASCGDRDPGQQRKYFEKYRAGTPEADNIVRDICQHPFLHGSQRAGRYQPSFQGTGIQLRRVRREQRKNFPAETASIWFPLSDLRRSTIPR